MKIAAAYQETAKQYKIVNGNDDLNEGKDSGIGSVDIHNINASAIKVEISTQGMKLMQLNKNKDFSSEIIQLEGTHQKANDLPEYSGIYSTDKAIATAVENCSAEEKGFVYDIIRQNFLISNSGDMTEDERKANISLGMKKAEYAANNFISDDKKQSFLDSMEAIAKLAVNGKANSDGEMDYNIYKGGYLGSGSNLVQVTDDVELMKQYDEKAYKEYKELQQKDGEDEAKAAMMYLLNWSISTAHSGKNYTGKAESDKQKYLSSDVKNTKLKEFFL